MVLIKKVGRAKIPITWIKSDASRHVTFTKRKKGLKKKVEELAILCGVEVCMICFGPQAGKPSSTPYSWGLPGVSHVIDKYRSLSKEEQDKKKLDNTSLLEQQIKKLRTEIRIKKDQNESLVNQRASLLWDDHLYTYGADDLRRLAEIVCGRLAEVNEKIAYISQQQQDLLGLSNSIEQHTGSNSAGEVNVFTTVPFTYEVRMPGPYQKLVAGVDPSNNFGEGTSLPLGAAMMNENGQGSEHGLINQISHFNMPAYIDKQKSAMPIDNSGNCTNGNVYLNIDSMLPLSTEMSYLSSPSLALRVKKHEQLAELSPTMLNGLTEPHALSNMTWQQAVGLELDDHMQCSPMSGRPNEHHGGGQWSVETTFDSSQAEQDDSKNAVVLEGEAYNAMASQNVNNHPCHASCFETDNQSEAQVSANALQTSILHHVRQLAALSSDAQELAYQEAAESSALREGTLMWNLEEDSPKTSSVYQSHMLAGAGSLPSGEGLTSLDSILEGNNETLNLNLLQEQDGLVAVTDVRMISF